MKKIYLFVIFFLLNSVYANEEIKSAQILFKKIVREDKKEIDNVEGIMYFIGGENILIKVTKPINQIILINNFTNTFYYPDEKNAVMIIYSKPVVSRTKMQFDLFGKEDMGFSDIGYKIEKSYKSNDILISIWTPPEKFKKQLGKVELGMKKNKIVLNKTYSPDGKLISIAEFDNFYYINKINIPGKIKTTIFDKKVKEEEVTYIDPKINIELPAEIKNFKLPENTKIKETEW